MPSYPWISVNQVNDELILWTHKISVNELCRHDGDAYSSLISLVGSKKKSLVLAHLLGHKITSKPHGQVHLTHSQGYTYIDCELTHEASPGINPRLTACTPRSIEWLHNDREHVSDFSNIFVSNVLMPLSNVICYFATDLHGVQGISSMIARQAIQPKAHTLPQSALPHVLVVFDTQKRRFNAIVAAKKLRAEIIQGMKKLKHCTDHDAVERDLMSRFRSVQIIGLQKRTSLRKQCEQIERRLATLAQEVQWSRRTSRYLFSTQHIDTLADRMVSRFCKDRTSFNFVRESRPEHFQYQQFETHLRGILALMPSQCWLWQFTIPLLASAIFLANYPRGSHNFPPCSIFDEFYALPCQKSIETYTNDTAMHAKFTTEVKRELEDIFRRYEFDPDAQSAIRQHTKRLTSLWPHFSQFKSSKSCFSCLMLMPEKVFFCGHAICNICVRRFGQQSQYEKHTFYIAECPLCGHIQPKDKSTFRLIPPTAGIRILCLDGGGIRGVIPLTVLKTLERELGNLGCPIHELFDYICGTSAGGLIAIGIFLMQWSPSDCLDRFEKLAIETFRQQQEKLSWTQHLQRVFGACLRDHRYNLSPIEKAFHSALDTSEKMFNPLQSDTKVAVTATTVRANMPCVLSNYNGSPRSDDSNYFHVRADSHDHEISISDAAACTSAAPFFFKSKDVDNLDTYQDGGLQHNNPAFITSWECASLWPDKCQIFEPRNCQIDQMVSLGTGKSPSSKYRIGPHSPKRERFPQRLMGNFMRHLDGEKQWETFIRCVPSELRSRFHRLNVGFSGSEPALDEVAAIERLKQQADHFVKTNTTLMQVKDSIISSVFYFELDAFAQLEGGGYQCSGTIHCRLPLDVLGRKTLYYSLVHNSAFFVVSGRPIASSQSLPQGFPAFRQHVNFIAKDMEQKINITIGGLTSHATPISGMPTHLSKLIRAQCLHVPFGCVDSRDIERPLPHTPVKRKVDQI